MNNRYSVENVHLKRKCIVYGYSLFSLRLTESAMFGATFNLVTRVGLP